MGYADLRFRRPLRARAAREAAIYLPSAAAVRRFTPTVLALLIGLCAAGATAKADPIAGIRPLRTDPVVPRGGVMLLPLAADDPQVTWPRTLPIELADGSVLEGQISWLVARPTPPRSHAWTSDQRGLQLQTSPPGMDWLAGQRGSAILLAELPENLDGPIRLLGRTISPRFVEVPPVQSGRSNEPLVRESRIDLPDPDSPFEYWRWVLLAERVGRAAPSPGPPGEPATLLARHYASLWRAGLARLEAQSRGVAGQIRDQLTRVCVDRDTPFAAWISDPSALSRLLAILLAEADSPDHLIEPALAWADEHDRLFVWLDSFDHRIARLAIVNPGFRPVVARLLWPGTEEIPLAVELPAGRLVRVNIERPVMEREPRHRLDRPADAPLQELHVEADDRTYRLLLDVPIVAAGPPAVPFPPMQPPLTLAAVQTGQPSALPISHAGEVQLRRLRGRWELFFECRRPQREPSSRPDHGGRDVDSFRGREAVIITIGAIDRDGSAETILAIPETGWHTLLRGTPDDTLRIHRRSYEDRWYCRVVLPKSWLRGLPGEVTEIGCLRTHAGSDMISATPMPTTPWRPEAGRLSLDLSEWTDLP